MEDVNESIFAGVSMLWTSKELGSNTDKHCGEFEPGLDPRRLGQCWSIIYDHRGKTEPMS